MCGPTSSSNSSASQRSGRRREKPNGSYPALRVLTKTVDQDQDQVQDQDQDQYARTSWLDTISRPTRALTMRPREWGGGTHRGDTVGVSRHAGPTAAESAVDEQLRRHLATHVKATAEGYPSELAQSYQTRRRDGVSSPRVATTRQQPTPARDRGRRPTECVRVGGVLAGTHRPKLIHDDDRGYYAVQEQPTKACDVGTPGLCGSAPVAAVQYAMWTASCPQTGHSVPSTITMTPTSTGFSGSSGACSRS